MDLSLLIESAIWTWVHRLGGPGLLIIGVVDGSAVPIPGSIDAFLIILAAHHRQWWLYYALMATAGALGGGYLTYRLAEKGGEETLEKKIGQERAKKFYRRFKAHGFATVAIGAILPPPFPTFPVVLTAGALHYPQKNFLLALGAGRAVRYLAVAYVARIYGQEIIGALSQYYKPILYGLIGLGVLGGIGALIYFKWYRARKQQGHPQHSH